MRFPLAVTLLIACGTSETVPAPDAETPDVAAQAADGPVTLYSGRSASVVDPLIEKLTAATGIEVEVQYAGTPAITSRLLAEGDETPADVIFVQDPGFLGLLTEREMLSKLPEATLEVVDARFRDAEGYWVGTSGRLRTLVIDTETLAEDQRPTSLRDLTDPKWKGKLGWAPSNSSFQAHVSGLRHTWGEAETRMWLQGLIDNEIRTYPKNSPQVAAANIGEIQVGWVNHYYLYRTDAEGRRAANYALPETAREGNLLMVAGAGVVSHTDQAESAQKVVDWLVSEDAQAHFVEGFEYPTRVGAPGHPEVPSLQDIPLAEIPQAHLSDLGPTREMLEELGLL
jgi:iron(III) transport system substrate-binding protein